MWVLDRNYFDSCLVLRGLAIRIGKCYNFTTFWQPSAYNLDFLGVQKKEGEDNHKKQGFIVENPQKYGAFYRKVGKMAKAVRAFLEENHAFLWVIGPKN